MIEIEPSDSVLTRTLVANHCLSSGLSVPDFIIAAQALNRAAALYSFNLRHFAVIPGLDVRSPYTR